MPAAAKTFRAFLITLVMFAPRADACSCVSSRQTERSVRDYVRTVYAVFSNVTTLRVIEVTTVGVNHERATLEVVTTWKGAHVGGERIQSDTPGIGEGSCAENVVMGQEIFFGFNDEPIEISGCPGDFELTRLELKWLRRLSPLKPARVN